MATYNNIKKIKIGDNIFNLYDSGNSGGTITSVKTTAGAHTAIDVSSGAATFNVPTKTSHLTNDSGFITSYTDTKVTNTMLDTRTDNTTFFLTGSESSNTETGVLVKGGVSLWLSSIQGHITMQLGNEVNQGRLGFRSHGHNVTLVPYNIYNEDHTYWLPDQTGTIALEENTPTKTSDLTNDSGFITADTNTTYTLSGALSSHTFTSTLTAGGSGSGTSTSALTLVAGNNITLTDDTTNKKITIAATDTTYSSKTAASGGTDVSLVTTGEKYIWNSKTSNTGTVTKVTAGTGLSIGTTAGGNFTTSGTINHTNSVTAQTTQALYPIKIDAQGHISAYGSAITSLPASDVSAWAKASSKPSYTASEVGAVPTTRTVNSKALSSDITLSASDIGAQAILVSGSNIKTINDISLLGSGDVWEALFNIVHPIYSFFETTDATFDPNTATGWYGTWELETEGLVHIGAGSTYTVGNTGGNKDAIIPYHRHSYTAPPSATDSHTLTASQIPAHTHGSKTLTGNANFRKWTTGKLLTYTDGIFSSSEPTTSATSAESSGSNPNKVDRLTITATHEHSSVGGGKGHTHTITGSSSNTGYAGASGNLTNANMQPYVVVNRWYRTA